MTGCRFRQCRGGPQRSGEQPAFTLIELLVVVAIIAILISILLPALSQARNQAKTSVCASNVRQLMIATLYYTEDTNGHLPWIRGSVASGYRNAPYDQFHQILILYPYMKDLKLFICPSAQGDNSVKKLFGVTLTGDPNDPTALGASHYFMRSSDGYYLQTAYRNNWWPQHNPANLPPGVDEFAEIYTEYWYNDFTSSLVQAGQGGATALLDAAGNPLPAMNGGAMGRIPYPAYAVPLTEYGWALPANKLRHSSGINLGFLDGHAERYTKKRFYDLDGRAASAADRPQDVDPYGNRPFYAWGLSRFGRDFLQ